jgi:hypothetical protein
MSAYTSYTLTEEQSWQLDGVKGSLAVANRDGTGIVVTCRLDKLAGMSETVALVTQGDSLTANTEPYRAVTISASAYPCDILLLVAPAHDLTLTSIASAIAGGIIGGSVNPIPGYFHADLTVSGAGTVTVRTPSVGMRMVITSVEISTDAAQRCMIVDGADTAGTRIRGGYFGVGGGLEAEILYTQAAINTPVKLVSAASGNVFAVVEGYETT